MTSSTSVRIQRRLDDLLEHLPAGVVVHGPDGRILSANPRAWELLGRPEKQLIGVASDGDAWTFLRADNTIMPPDEYPANRVLSTGQPLFDLVAGVPALPPEPLRWLLCNAYPERDDAGRIQRVVVCFTDCTQLKRAERHLRKSEERLQLALRGSTDAPWDIDLAGGEVYFSERWWEMLGYRPGQLASDLDTWSKLMHPDDAPQLAAILDELPVEARESYSFESRMRHREGHYVPVLSRAFVLRDEAGNALRISGTNTDLTERKLAEQRIHELAYFDHLTGLPNRRFLVEELERILARSMRSSLFGAVLFFDLDNFKLLNDTMGHDVGDLLLRQVSERLSRSLRHSDRIARLGGDEFVVVFENIGRAADEAVTEASHMVRKILAVLDQPYKLRDRLFSSTASIGVAMFDGARTDVETLLKQADLAMYHAKAGGRHMARFFDPGMQAAADGEAALELALRDGLSMRQFVLFCQPQYSKRGRLVGAEVLVRWRREDGALVGPGEFIGLAEASGLIIPLGHYVLEESCRTLRRWAGDALLCRLKLAVNVSVHQLRQPSFVAEVAGILADTHAPAGRLCLELTESVFAGDWQDLTRKMHLLRDRGLHFSLDDFGTGYSSLGYLKRFPVSALKIDRSFVHDVHVDPGAGSIVEAIIALARKLRLDIVAEGVEFEDQRRFLIDGGCGALQGFLLGRPVPVEEFERMHGAAILQ
jgi:diguanylate cyclase (GGDEF)-like protein/PAS domain S-box-containing protein